MNPQPDLSARMKGSAARTANAVRGILPVLLGVLLLASMVVQLIPKLIDSGVFGHTIWLDTLMALILGSLSTTQPIVSYVFGGELLKSGIDLLAVTALIVTWVTVGVIPLPAEAVALGWRFALWRNLWAFIAALLVSVLTVAGMHVIQG
jgi:uncharacterized membrane protein YraQ (UPF0718 family)